MDIIPPIDYFYEIPKEVNEKSLLKLPYETIVKSCSTSKYFNRICNDPYFWKAKLEIDYPEEILPKLQDSQYRAQYELFLAEDIDEEIYGLRVKKDNEIENKTYKDNRTIFQLLYDHASQNKSLLSNDTTPPDFEEYSKYASQSKEGKKIVDEYNKIKNYYDDQSNRLKYKSKSLKDKARKILPLVYEKKYIKLYGKLSEANKIWNESNLQIHKDFKEYIRKYGYNKSLNAGNLIGIIDKKYSNIPVAFIYIFSDKDEGLDFDYFNYGEQHPGIIEYDDIPTILMENYKTEEEFLKDYPEIDFDIINWR